MCAGVGPMGEFTDVPIETHAQVIGTNLLGHLHGAHAVLPQICLRCSASNISRAVENP